MSEKIEPALTAREWEDGHVRRGKLHAKHFTSDGSDSRGLFLDVPSGGSLRDPSELIAVIALANAALPDTDPRKITRAHVDALQAVVLIPGNDPQRAMEYVVIRAHLDALVDAIESYLPTPG